MYHLGMRSTPSKVLRLPNFPHLVENNVRKGFLEDGQYSKIVAHCPELWFRSIVECGRTYGWRISELLNMQVNQIDLAQRVIRLEPGTTKNREGREVVMTDAVYTLLSACAIDKAADDYVFTRASGKRVRDFRMPVILTPSDYDQWLDPGVTNPSHLADLLKPFDALLMRSYPVSKRVNRVENDDEECGREAPPNAGVQMLF
jgi:Phage integrase family/SOS response associated peptidase (SRAP)